MAADSMAKASTPEPFSSSRTSNWVARGGGLPPYVQHIAHDLMEKRGKTESEAIGMAIGIIKNWAHGKGNVHPDTRAAASKALAEWTALKAKAKASKVSESEAFWLSEGATARRPKAEPDAEGGETAPDSEEIKALKAKHGPDHPLVKAAMRKAGC